MVVRCENEFFQGSADAWVRFGTRHSKTEIEGFMEGKCPYCANTKGVLFEKANAETDSPLVGRCEHCRRILGFTPDVKSMMHILEEKLRIDRPNNG